MTEPVTYKIYLVHHKANYLLENLPKDIKISVSNYDAYLKEVEVTIDGNYNFLIFFQTAMELGIYETKNIYKPQN